MQGTDPLDRRSLLAALAARTDLARAAVCRLGAELERWIGEPRATPELARELSMDLDSLSKAFDLRADAPAVARRLDARARRAGARLVTREDEGWPAALDGMALPPPALHVAGDLAALAAPAIAVVGSREASRYGLEVARWFGRSLAAAGWTVVSGFARGIDAAAHRGALLERDGRTVAVLGCGLGYDYPKGHAPLGEAIRRRGALVSEFPCGEPPRTWQFPVRNRILAALARATIVVEAAPRSGSLLTARLALEAGRDVLAVPGRITDELALGTNALLADGAAPAIHPDDVLEFLARGGDFAPRKSRPEPAGLRAAARAAWRALDETASRAPDELAAALAVPVDRLLATLLDLELAGHVVRLPGGTYRRG